MNKALVIALLLVGSLGLAQSANRSAFGIYLIGGQYTIDLEATELRLGLGFPLLVGGGGALLTGSADVLFPMGKLNANTRWSLGAGTEIYLVLGGVSGAVFTPRGFVNFEFGGDGISLFIEGGAQGVIAVGGGAVFGGSLLIPHGRLGVNFR